MSATVGTGIPAGPQLIRAMNEQLVLGHIRRVGQLSRSELVQLTRLSKPTVSLTLTHLERAGLVRTAGRRTGTPGPAATLYEIRPEAGYVVSLDVGSQFLRGAICDLAGTCRARIEVVAEARTGAGRVAELIALGDTLRSDAGIDAGAVTQSVLGTPGVYDPGRDTLSLTGAQPDWERPEVLTGLRAAFGDTLMIENDIDAAAMAERDHGHGRGVDSFAFVSVGTGIGMGLVLDGQLRRGAHGAAGEIGYLPIEHPGATDRRDARRRGRLEAAGSAAGIVRAARRAGMRRIDSARAVFAAAAGGDARAVHVVQGETDLVARAVASVVAVVDPDLIVLGGGIGRSVGFLAAVEKALPRFAPVLPQLRVTALGADAVVDGCLAAGLEQAWSLVAPGLVAPGPAAGVNAP